MSIKSSVPGPTQDAPSEPHLVLVTGVGEGIAIAPGSMLMLVEGRAATEQFPLVLKQVSHKRLVFQLGHTDYEYRLLKGKPLTKDAVARMRKNRGG